MEVLETSGPDMYIDDGRLGDFHRPLKYCYGDELPFILLKALEIYREHRRRYKRAKLSRRGKRVHIQQRLPGVQSREAAGSDKKCGTGFVSREITQSVPKFAPAPLKLRREGNLRLLSLTHATFFPKVGGQGGETIVGGTIVQSSKAASSEKKCGAGFVSREITESVPQYAPAPLKLQMEEKHRVISLTDVTIFPKVGGQGGETIVGTLEAHANGFIYTASSFRMQFFFKDIKTSLFRLGDKRMPPLVHFHLQEPIMMGTEKTKDIQFQLVQCFVGQKRSDHDSDKIEKEKQIRVGGQNRDLKNFVVKVEDQRSSVEPYFFEKIEKDYEFYGVLPSKEPASFALTLYSLIVLVETPFVVVPLGDIEIVNLALLRPGEIDMTVVFQDLKKDVLEINSIPLVSLTGIIHSICHVQYYVNAEKPDWKSILKGRAEFPEKFIENGGWDYFKLEDSTYYKEKESNTKWYRNEEC